MNVELRNYYNFILINILAIIYYDCYYNNSYAIFRMDRAEKLHKSRPGELPKG
jgi:hypothetical protein